MGGGLECKKGQSGITQLLDLSDYCSLSRDDLLREVSQSDLPDKEMKVDLPKFMAVSSSVSFESSLYHIWKMQYFKRRYQGFFSF